MAWSKVTESFVGMVPERDWDPKLHGILLKSQYSVYQQDNFTVLLLRYNRNIIVGVAKRNPHDRWRAEVAFKVAVVRAYRKFKQTYSKEK